jgi:hypothetical protein
MAFGRAHERREHTRDRVMLHGRLMLADRRELPCTVIDASVSGAALLAADSGEVGEAVVVYLTDSGRIQGKIVRHFAGGFAIKLTGTPRAAEALVRRFELA